MYQKTTEEVRNEFLEQIMMLIKYWKTVEGTTEDKLNGLAFSILTLLDGNHGDQPKFIVSPETQPDIDISGVLHEVFGAYVQSESGNSQ